MTRPLHVLISLQLCHGLSRALHAKSTPHCLVSQTSESKGPIRIPKEKLLLASEQSRNIVHPTSSIDLSIECHQPSSLRYRGHARCHEKNGAPLIYQMGKFGRIT